jgi:hypothetical protein
LRMRPTPHDHAEWGLDAGTSSRIGDGVTQAERVLVFLTINPGATVMELQLALRPFVSNPRARISDLRAAGNIVECRKRTDGQRGFWVLNPAQLALAL